MRYLHEMKIDGSHVVDLDVASLWPLLQDEEVLAKISPGIGKIIKTEEYNYTAISDINIGPVRGSFEGELTLTDVIEHETMTLNLTQLSKIGNAKASIKMILSALDDHKTQINYQGDAKVSGRLATMGQRILGGVVKTLSKQVFKELDKVIEEMPKKEMHEAQVAQVQKEPSSAQAPQSHGQESPLRGSDNSVSHQSTKSYFQIILEKIKSIWK